MTIVLLSLIACKEEAKPEQGDPPIEEVVEPSEEEVTECDEGITTTPSTELPISNWFYRDPVRLKFNEPNLAISVQAQNAAGDNVPVVYEWNDSRELAEVLPESGTWAGNESYTLSVSYCQHNTELSFATSDYGLPLDGNPAGLIGNTYNIDLATANYTDPPGIGTLLGQNIDQPLLFGVDSIGGGTIDFIAALGIVDDFGNTSQSTGLWTFPDADFSGVPYFDAYSEFLSIEYGTITIPIYDFVITGTFSADGNRIGKAHFEGLGDTRELGPALSPGMGEDAICNMLAASGAECQICPGIDTEEAFCAFLAGDIDQVEIIPDFMLEDMD